MNQEVFKYQKSQEREIERDVTQLIEKKIINTTLTANRKKNQLTFDSINNQLND